MPRRRKPIALFVYLLGSIILGEFDVANASTAGQSFADGEWRRKCNGVVIVGPAALLADDPGSPQGGKPSGWRAQRARSKGGKGGCNGERLTYGSGNGGTLVANAKGQGKGGKKGGGTSEQQKQQQLQQHEQQQNKGSYKNSRADLGGGDAGKQPVYKPARSGPWVRCECPTCPGYGNWPSFKYISAIEAGSACFGCGTEWDFSLALFVQ